MDALAYAVEQKTGYDHRHGHSYRSLYCCLRTLCNRWIYNHQPVMNIMKASGDYMYERVWQLPLMSEYKLQLKSLFADIRNHGGREAGAITAAMFLSHFVAKVPWIHLDVAGVSWFDSETSLITEGASGIGVRLVVDFLKRLVKEDASSWKKEAEEIEDPTFKEDEVDMSSSIPRYHRNKYLFSS